MKARAIAAAALLFTGLTSTARAQVVGCDVDQLAIDAICSLQLGSAVTVSEVVCISDFQYTPANLEAAVGDTVAWVNVEACGDNPVEAAVAPNTGCDPTHEVITAPSVPGATGDTIVFLDICSPNPPVPGPGVTEPVPSPCGPQDTNVRCHTFGSAGVQHYTCETNPAHTALMHGSIAVQ